MSGMVNCFELFDIQSLIDSQMMLITWIILDKQALGLHKGKMLAQVSQGLA